MAVVDARSSVSSLKGQILEGRKQSKKYLLVFKNVWVYYYCTMAAPFRSRRAMRAAFAPRATTHEQALMRAFYAHGNPPTLNPES